MPHNTGGQRAQGQDGSWGEQWDMQPFPSIFSNHLLHGHPQRRSNGSGSAHLLANRQGGQVLSKATCQEQAPTGTKCSNLGLQENSSGALPSALTSHWPVPGLCRLFQPSMRPAQRHNYSQGKPPSGLGRRRETDCYTLEAPGYHLDGWTDTQEPGL